MLPEVESGEDRSSDARSAALAARKRGDEEAAAAKVRPGGLLVYATCSLLAQENEDRARAFAARHPRWAPEGERRLSPLDGGDGFFIARFRAPARR